MPSASSKVRSQPENQCYAVSMTLSPEHALQLANELTAAAETARQNKGVK